MEGGRKRGAGAGGCLRRLVTSPPSQALGLLGDMWSAFGRKGPLFRPFCIGRGCPFVPSTLE